MRQEVSDYLATLQPKTDAQKAALATANQYASLFEQSRLLISLQIASGPVSWPLIAILVFWTAALFFAMGLYAPSNALVTAALTFGALSIAFAIFLILELGMPYTGLLRFARRARANDRVHRQVAVSGDGRGRSAARGRRDAWWTSLVIASILSTRVLIVW